MPPIYMDSHATTPVDPRVLEAMLPFFTEHFGNASSRNHPFGWKAGKAVETAREQIAPLIGARFRDVVFTSGATESNNLAIKGAAARAPEGRRHVVTLATEHRSVLDPCRSLEQGGFRVTYLGVRPDGLVDLGELEAAVTDGTLLVSVMAANNEIGVLQPLKEIGRIAKSRGALFHCDAAQAAGTVPIDARALELDLVSLSAHKIYGPKGVGVLYVAKNVHLEPLVDGGGHERGFRSGTLDVPGIVGFGAAAEICRHTSAEETRRLRALRDRLWNGLRSDRVHANGSMEHRLPQNLNVRVDGAHGDELLKSLASEVAISSGAACATTSAEPSHVLKALGLSDAQARASLRFGLGRHNTEAEVDRVIELVRCRVGS
ncbi:MAG: aminotransferase class V-fold PLP-dependent enzyme [Vicinamibacterales bacterium]|nr:aminotransferase class V-fold PLP-dependent enzyme [Vicinamibacterales bacterium]